MNFLRDVLGQEGHRFHFEVFQYLKKNYKAPTIKD